MTVECYDTLCLNTYDIMTSRHVIHILHFFRLYTLDLALTDLQVWLGLQTCL